MRTALAVIAISAACLAQSGEYGTVSGVVRDAATGLPIQGAEVSIGSDPQTKTWTDAAGRYRLSGVPAGAQVIRANGPANARSQPTTEIQTRGGVVGAGKDVEYDFRVAGLATVEGTVLDEERRPVKSALVAVVVKRYQAGAARFIRIKSTVSNTEGRYSLEGVPAGEPFLLFAGRLTAAPAGSGAGGALTAVDTYYPHATTPGAGEELVLSRGEIRTRIDIRQVQMESYSVSGIVEGGAGVPVDIAIYNADLPAASGRSDFVQTASAADGKFRIAGLPRGNYRLAFSVGRSEGHLAALKPAAVDREDVKDLRVELSPDREIPCQFTLAEQDPAPPPGLSANVRLNTIGGFPDVNLFMTAKLPNATVWKPEPLGEYFFEELKTTGSGIYVKDIFYGGASVHYGSIQAGGEDLLFVMGRDGGSINLQVVDSEGKPAPGANIAIVPEGLANEAQFAAAVLIGQAGRNGDWNAGPLAPGKYVALATGDLLDSTAFRIDKLWAAQARGKAIELSPNANLQVQLTVQDLGAN